MRATSLTLLPLAALWLVSTTTPAATVYKWVDEKGVTHYSDQPHPQAKEVEVTAAQSYASRPATLPAAASTTSAESAPRYGTCEIYRPENDEVFLNTDTMTAKLRLEPLLIPGDRVVLWLDGRRLANQPTVGTEFVISQLDRGTHTLVISVENSPGKEACKTNSVTFHVRQPSTKAPVRAVRPKF